MANEWVGVIHDTAPSYLMGAADLTIRNRLWLSMLQKYNRIRLGENGYQCTWTVQKTEQPIESYGDAGTINFSRHDLYAQLTHDWRGYKGTDQMTEKERLMNAGDVAIIKRYSRVLPTLVSSLQNKFGGELFVDGNLAGNENRLHGLESFFGAGTVATGDLIAMPSDTYAGLSTALQAAGGTWSANLATSPNSTVATDWPYGQGDAEYDYLSPKLINTSSTNWGTGSTAWEDNCERVLRQGTIWLTHGGGRESRPTMHLLSSDLFFPYLNKQESKQRILVPHKEADDLGFPDTLNQEGVMVKYEYDVPARTGYSINIFQMDLASLDSVLFSRRGPTYDIKTDSYLFMVGFFGNCKYSPKHFAKYYPYA